jgi:hypothetical protein
MIEELHLFGVYMPAALVWAVIAGILAYLLRNLLQRLPLYHLLWHPGVLELALFMALWWGLTVLADNFLSRALVS